jgi:hypothetical protein
MMMSGLYELREDRDHGRSCPPPYSDRPQLVDQCEVSYPQSLQRVMGKRRLWSSMIRFTVVRLAGYSSVVLNG